MFGQDRRSSQRIAQQYGLGNFDRDFAAVCNFDPLPAVGAAVAGSNAQFSITGAGAPVPTLLNPGNTRPGGLNLTTRAAAADNDEARLTPYAVSQFAQQLRPTIGELTVVDAQVCALQIASVQIYAGVKLTDTGVVATDADQAFFLFDTDPTLNFGPAGVGTLAVSPNWYAVWSVGGNDFAVDTQIPLVVNRDYRLKIILAPDGRPQFYINGSLRAAGTVLTAAAALQTRMGVATRAVAQASAGFRLGRFQRRIPAA